MLESNENDDRHPWLNTAQCVVLSIALPFLVIAVILSWPPSIEVNIVGNLEVRHISQYPLVWVAAIAILTAIELYIWRK